MSGPARSSSAPTGPTPQLSELLSPMNLLTRWSDCALRRLGEARAEIDALNVYPVPDGDTGTNLYLTFEAACQAMKEAHPTSLAKALIAFGRGALMGARGNSGVILSQLLRAGADQLMRGDLRSPGQLLADTLALAADAAYAAVGQPVEGTILSIARAAADAAQGAAGVTNTDVFTHMQSVIVAAAEAGRTALDHTPEQLEVLKMAGVVDAGGRGLSVLLDAAQEVCTGVRPESSVQSLAGRPRPLIVHAAEAGGPSAEVMYLLEASADAVPALRRRLGELGDSLVVVGGDDLWNVHVHVDDVGAAIEAGIEAGRPYRVRVTSLSARTDGSSASSALSGSSGSSGLSRLSPASTEDLRAVVAVAAGAGLRRLFIEAGAYPVTVSGGERCSTTSLLDAIRSSGTAEVVVLPNDADTVAVAEAAAAAARDEGIRTTVIPTRSQVQGLAAMAVHQPNRSYDDDVVSMTAAAGHTRHGAVMIAPRNAMTMAGPCRAGDGLGLVEGDFAVVAEDLGSAAAEVVRRLLGSGGELLTLVTGEQCDQSLVQQVRAAVAGQRPDVDILVYEGAQTDYPLLIGVE